MPDGVLVSSRGWSNRTEGSNVVGAAEIERAEILPLADLRRIAFSMEEHRTSMAAAIEDRNPDLALQRLHDPVVDRPTVAQDSFWPFVLTGVFALGAIPVEFFLGTTGAMASLNAGIAKAWAVHREWSGPARREDFQRYLSRSP
jgi:hypothetical protein